MSEIGASPVRLEPKVNVGRFLDSVRPKLRGSALRFAERMDRRESRREFLANLATLTELVDAESQR
jgi:hypothetical protein